MHITQKKVLVTGASRGIGKAIALQLARQGAEVIIHYLDNRAEAEQVLADVKLLGGKGHLLQADFADPQNAVILGDRAWQIAGGIDILINNAGVSHRKHFFDHTIFDLDHFININFKSTLLLTQDIAKKMVLDKIEGCIYTLTSINAIQPGVGFSVYGATKGALETLMKGIALELAPHNITVNTIAPGAIETDMTVSTWQDPERLRTVRDQIPLNRLGQAEEVAEVVVGLIMAGSYITGTTIKIDGGWLLKNGHAKPEKYKSGDERQIV